MFYSKKGLTFLNSKKGFTLLEILIVVVIIGVLAGVAIPNVTNQLPHYRLRTATRKLVSNLMKAKAQAVAENASYEVCFKLPNQYTVSSNVSSCSAPPTWGPFDLSPDHPEIVYDEIKFGSNRLIFSSDGTIRGGKNETDLRMYLKNNKAERYLITFFITGAIRVN